MMVTICRTAQIAALTLTAHAALAADEALVPACHRAPPPLAIICSGYAPVAHPKMDPAVADKLYGGWGGSFGGAKPWTTKGGR